MCRKSLSSSWRWLVLAAALISGIVSVTAQPSISEPSADPATALGSILSSLSTSEISEFWFATLDGLESRSAQDRASFERYVETSEKAAETAMLRELSLSRTVMRLENRLTAATTAIDASGQSATSSSAVYQQTQEEARRLLRGRNAWRGGAIIAAGLAVLSLIF